MKETKAKYLTRKRRKMRIRKKIFGTEDKPRLSVYKSNRYLYAQLIDDENTRTLVGISSLKYREGRGNAKSVEIAKKLGKDLGRQAKEKGIKQIVFDRSGYPYHGRIKVLAEGAREQGVKF
ncbi:MAG: 50S ribosomal protein L18 [Candidatus Aerophobetes bacterium]|nr:50S ribosomal protein L18 [Candidatus Aerophobetes bacterium]